MHVSVCECVSNVQWSVSQQYPLATCPPPCPLCVGWGVCVCMGGGGTLFIGSHPCQCFMPISQWHFRGWGKKAKKQCNGEKDLQHSTIELKESWRMKQTPRLPLATPSPSASPASICAAWCTDHTHKRMETQRRTRAAILHELLIMIWEIYDVGFRSHLLIPSLRASLSSVKSNEQMLLSCWSQDDGLSCWQAHPSAER